VVPIPPNVTKWVNGRQVWYYSTYSNPNKSNVPDSLDEVPNSYLVYINLVAQIGRLEMATDFRTKGNTLTLLTKFATYAERMASLNFYLDRVIKRLSLVSFLSPISPAESRSEYHDSGIIREVIYNKIPIRVSEIVSSMLLTNFDSLGILKVKQEIYEFGWSVNHYFDSLACVTAFIKGQFTHVKYGKTFKINKIFEMLTANLSFSNFLKTKMGSYPTIYDFLSTVIPPVQITDYLNNDFVQRLEASISFIKKNPERFGYTDKFYYGEGGLNPEPMFYRRAWILPKNAKIFKSYSFEELLHALSREEISNVL